MEDIQEESGESCSSSDDDEGDGPEFVPSAWDKYATPTKSALRSPEKTDKVITRRNTEILTVSNLKFYRSENQKECGLKSKNIIACTSTQENLKVQHYRVMIYGRPCQRIIL